MSEVQIMVTTDRLNTHYIAEERTILDEIEKWSHLEENIWRQKARIDLDKTW